MVQIDMEMPKSCFDCIFCDANFECCLVTRIMFEENFNFRKRQKDCPLREVRND